MDRANTIVFYRVEEGRAVEKGRREVTDEQRVKLHQKRLQDIFADHELLDDFNRGQPEDRRADAFSVGSLIVQMTKS